MKYSTIIVIFFLFACQKESIIFDSRPNADFELPLLLQINGKNCVFDAENKILKYSIQAKDLSAFKAKIEFQETSEIGFNGKTLRNGAINDLGRLQLNRAYPLTIKNNNSERQFQLVFTAMPILQLVMHDPIVNEPKVLAKLTMNYPEYSKKSEVHWLGVEHRGASSLKYDKKSIGFEAYRGKSNAHIKSISFFESKANSKWILNAMYVDKAKMRNKVSFKIWNTMRKLPPGKRINPQYVELFVNNEAFGLFTLEENYTKEFLDLGDEAKLYKGVESIATTRFLSYPTKLPRTSTWGGWEQVLPNPNYELDWENFQELSRLISQAGDDEFLEKIDRLLDLENVIDYYLFVNLFRGSDSVAKNWFFLQKDEQATFEILPWDIDVSWGRNARGEELDYETIVTNRLFTRLKALNPSDYRNRLNKRWLDLRSTIFIEDYLLNLFYENFEQLMEYQIIPYENQIWNVNVDLDTEMIYIKEWFDNRLDVLDEYFGD